MITRINTAGDVSVREAIAQSINTVAVQVEMRIGVSSIINMAHRLGVTGSLPADASLALGTSDVSGLTKLTSAYAAVANGGEGLFPYGVPAGERCDRPRALRA